MYFFVSYLNGSDNEVDYLYMGILNKSDQYKLTKKSNVKFNSTVNKAFNWLWNNVKLNKSFPSNFHFYHARCGRKLTTPKSIEARFGPVCIKRK